MRQVISFTLDVLIEDRGDHWEAYIEPLGMTVYGDTESAANARVFQAMDFLKGYFATKNDGMQSFKAYLDAHGVPSHVTTDAVQNGAATRIHYLIPMDIPLEVAASG